MKQIIPLSTIDTFPALNAVYYEQAMITHQRLLDSCTKVNDFQRTCWTKQIERCKCILQTTFN